MSEDQQEVMHEEVVAVESGEDYSDDDSGSEVEQEESGKNYTEGYVKRLRSQAKKKGDAFKEAQSELDTVRAEFEALKQSQEKIEKWKSEADERVLKSEMKRVATEAGLRDLDLLKMIDAEITIDKNGDVIGAVEAIAAMKEAKPYLFEEAIGTTKSTIKIPESNKVTKPNFKSMSRAELEEYERSQSRKLKGY